jgi:hypothetical protein
MGQLSLPLFLSFESDVKSIHAGVHHIGVILENDEIDLWALNDSRRSIPHLEGDIVDRPVKLEVDFIVSSLSLGSDFTLALSVEGKVYGWGRDILFEGFGVDAPQKITVVSQNATAIQAGKSSAFYSQEGQFFSWGANQTYELGLETIDQVSSPRLVNFEWQQRQVPSKTSILCYSLHSQLSFSTVELLAPPSFDRSRNSLLSNLEEYIDDEALSDLTIVVGHKTIRTSKVC